MALTPLVLGHAELFEPVGNLLHRGPSGLNAIRSGPTGRAAVYRHTTGRAFHSRSIHRIGDRNWREALISEFDAGDTDERCMP